MNTIYLVSYYFAPLGRADGVNRTYFVKYLSDFGWKMHIITGTEYRSLILNFQKDPSLLTILPPSVQMHRFKSHEGWIGYDFKKILGIKNNLRDHWIKRIEKDFIPQEPGVMMAVIPPVDNALLAYALAKKYSCPLALYYPDEVLDVPAHIVEYAKVIFCVTEQIRSSLIDRYRHPNVVVVEHGLAELATCPEKKETFFPLKMVYAGSFNFRIRPELVGKAYRQLMQRDSTQARNLTIDFYGPSGYYLWLFLRPYLNKNVRYKGYLPFSELMKTLPNYDIALTVNAADVAFPSKVFHYLNAGLPLFAVTQHLGLMDFVQKHSIGLVCNDHVGQIADQLLNLIQDKDRILQWRQNVLNIREGFYLKTCLGRIHEVLMDLASKSENINFH